jgi:hypothetical protein
LPLQKNQNNSAKCLILLGARGQKPGKTGFGVELGGSCPLSLALWIKLITAAPRWPARKEPANNQLFPANGDGPDLIRNMVVIDRQMPVICQPDQLIPLCGLA